MRSIFVKSNPVYPPALGWDWAPALFYTKKGTGKSSIDAGPLTHWVFDSQTPLQKSGTLWNVVGVFSIVVP